MITSFNPADMSAVNHIRRVLATFPGVFTGIGFDEGRAASGRGSRPTADEQ